MMQRFTVATLYCYHYYSAKDGWNRDGMVQGRGLEYRKDVFG